jgi:carbon-monoxide dehydrogenase large subunit
MTTTVSAMGGTVRRREDPGLIYGDGRFVDDIKAVGELHAVFVRSPYARASVLSIDASDALALPGVRAVYTIDDVRDLGPLLAQVPVGKLRPLLADGVVNHAGEAVAMVVAESATSARDGADAVHVEYDPLEPVIDLKRAATDEIKIHENLESNVLLTWLARDWWPGVFELEDHRPAIEEAKQRDDTVVVSHEFINQRLIPVAIEPRSVLADWQHGYDAVTLHTASQVPHAVAGAVARTFGLAAHDVRAIAPEVGGGFGSKLNVYIEEILTCFASRELHRPVHWTETRREAASATIHGRDWVGTATITGTRDGDIFGFELDALANMGAYTQNFTVAIPLLGLWVGSGQYDIKLDWSVGCVVTNTQTTDAYRGAGRPEALYYLERIIDMYAREIGMDPAEVRRKNYLKKEDMPAAVPSGLSIDSGDYETNLDALLEAADYEGLLAMREAARAEGRYVGVGLSTYLEICGFGPSVLAEIGFGWDNYGLPSSFSGSGLVRVHPDGTATVIIGTGPSGQGHKTTWAQIVSGQLGIEVENIRVAHGDTAESPMGIGTFGSRSAAVDGAATYEAAQKVRHKAAQIAAHMLEAAEEDIRFGDGGAHVVGTPGHTVSWAEIAEVAYKPHKGPDGMDAGLEAHAVFSPGNATWPFGSHIAVVEVDAETGNVEILRYITADDCGNQINPMIVGGQLHGGIAQGIGQAVFEEAVYDANGNLLTGSLTDYPLPTAADLPSFELHHTVTPTDVNPMGVKGIGEAGTIGSAQTIVNAVVDALAPLGVKHVDMPLRPKNVWQAIQDAGE